MAVNIKIEKYRIEALKKIIEQLGINQAMLAEKANNYKPSALTSFLQGKSKIRDKNFENLVIAVNSIFREKAANLRQLDSFNEVHKNLMIFSKGIKGSDYKIQVPAGSLNHDAINYVERSSDNDLYRFLESDSAASILITGGIQYGKTSLIKRFIVKAEKRNCKIIYIDFKDLLFRKNPISLTEIFIHIVEKAILGLNADPKKIAELEKEIKGRNSAQPGDWAKEYIQSLLETNEKTLRTFLIIDSIDSLFTHFDGVEEINTLIFWLSMIRNAMEKPPFDTLTIIAVDTFMTFTSHSPVKASPPFKTQSHIIPIGEFEKKHLLELGKRIGVEMEVESNIEKLYNLFGGQPHLTHKAIFELYNGKNFTEIELTANMQLESYGTYWRNLTKSIGILLKQKGYEGKLRAIFHTILNENYHSPAYEIVKELFEPFVISGILSKYSKLSSNFIKKSIENEIK